MDHEGDGSTAMLLGAVVALGAVLFGYLAFDGLVSGETANIMKYRMGKPITGAKGVGVAIAYGTFAAAMALFTIACFNTADRQRRLLYWSKRVCVAAVAVLIAAGFFLK